VGGGGGGEGGGEGGWRGKEDKRREGGLMREGRIDEGRSDKGREEWQEEGRVTRGGEW